MAIKALQHPLHRHIFLFRPHTVFFFLSFPLLLSLSSTLVAVATVPSLRRVERNDRLTRDSLSLCMFGLTAGPPLGPGLGPSPWSSVAPVSLLCPKLWLFECCGFRLLIILQMSTGLSSRECDEADNHQIKTGGGEKRLVFVSTLSEIWSYGSGRLHSKYCVWAEGQERPGRVRTLVSVGHPVHFQVLSFCLWVFPLPADFPSLWLVGC